MKKTVLITGGAGYVGTFLAKRLIESRKYNLFLLFDDLTLDDFVVPAVDVVIHLAGKQNYSFKGTSDELITANFQSTVNLARKCSQDVHFIFLSSDYVFESNPDRDYEEQDDLQPETVYGKSKVMAETFLQENFPNVSLLRTSLIYGYDHPRRNNFFKFVKSKLEKKESVELFTDVYSRPTHILDVCKVIERIAEDEVIGIHHFSGNECVNRYDLGQLICNIGRYNTQLIKPVEKPSHVGIPKYLSLKTSPIFENERSVQLQDGLRHWLSDSLRW